MSKTLLLDFDGVIFNNSKMNQMIQHRATIYFQHHTRMPYHVAAKLNSKYYKPYGHTVYFMKDILEDSDSVSIKEFNEFVYSSKTLDTISKELNSNDVQMAKMWRDTIQQFKENDYFIKLFSNAPSIWIDRCLEELPYNLNYLLDDCFCFDNLENLKPNKNSYNCVHESEQKIVFVDDSVDNLKPVQHYEHWKPVHFGESEGDIFFSTMNPLTIQHFI